jgi:amidohydrolase
VVAAVRSAAAACLGTENVVETHQSMGSEDFSWLLQDVPGAMARLGAALNDRKVDLHSPRFDIDERAIEAGIAIAVESLLRLAEQ